MPSTSPRERPRPVTTSSCTASRAHRPHPVPSGRSMSPLAAALSPAPSHRTAGVSGAPKAYRPDPCLRVAAGLDAYFGAHLAGGVPLLCTVLSMSVSPYVPSSIPLVMGTEALAQRGYLVIARRYGCSSRRSTPRPTAPVDRRRPAPPRKTRGSGRPPARRHRVQARAGPQLDALINAIDAVAEVAGELPVTLLVVGKGPAGAALRRERSMSIASGTGRGQVRRRPRGSATAYAAADLVLGMGGSSLRAMAGRGAGDSPGRAWLLQVSRPSSLDSFLRHGFEGSRWAVPPASPGGPDARLAPR